MKRPIRRRITRLAATAAAVLGGVLVAPTPAHAAWGTTYDLSIQATYQFPTGSTTQVGRADGWVQFDDGGDTFRYSLTVCRQSGYTTPELQVAVNAGWVGQTWEQTNLEYFTLPTGSTVTPTAPCYGDTNTVTGQDTYTNFSNVEFVLFGDTIGASGYTTVSKKYVGVSPY
ncbi:hypothetical protein [Actinacidiphila sp. ITFR-21]|uniref:hypothetical protein n=1 Tax=Actinacidiphila sp. ITFR-21 TaxID=3075199 RepID=UPI00288927A5|nr:hypothetical protein [Streptomyces sp. ITFR-21]WNI16021.1 hypothetical protein RLT57_11115 [Streptomyces sp. ITFR-21]